MADARSRDNGSATWRLIAVITLALLALFQSFIAMADIGASRGHFGWFEDDPNAPMLITHLTSGGSAQRAGIKVGDIIDLDRLYPKRKTSFDPILSFRGMPGDRVDVPIIRRSTRLSIPVILGSEMPDSLSLDIANDVGYVIGALALLLGGWLVIQSPSLMTWSLYGFLVSASGGDPQALNRFGWTVSLVDNLLIALGGAAFAFIIVFATRAPNDAVSRWRTWFIISALALFALSLFSSAYPIVAWSIFGISHQFVFPPAWLPNVTTGAVYALTFSALIVNYAIARGSDRQRLKWIVLGVVLTIGPGLIYQYVPSIEYRFWIRAALAVVSALGIAAIAYAIVKGRIVDVKFVVSRAVVAAVLAGSIIIAFAIIDWLVSKHLQATRLGALTEIGLAIALGFWFSGLHRNVDRFVDQVFFRKRYAAEQQLILASHAVLHCTSIETIRDVLVDEPAAALDLASAALFEPVEGTTWHRTRETGWASASLDTLAGDDALLLHLQAEQVALRISSMRWRPLGLPPANAQPVLAVPVLARRRVIAIALYGEHTSGVDIDPDEIRAIEKVADAAGAAYDHVEAETFRRKYEELELRLAQIR